MVLERGRVGESWRTQRWESFRLNTPGWMNQLLGEQARDSYATGVEVVQRLEKLAADLPGPRRGAGGPVGTRRRPVRPRPAVILARTVVVATGDQNLPKVPALAGRFPDRVAQYHTADYRGPDQLPDGAVLVVGSAQSGCQIAEDLLAGGRRVVLATSPSVACPSGTAAARASSGWPRPGSWTSGPVTCPTHRSCGRPCRSSPPGAA